MIVVCSVFCREAFGAAGVVRSRSDAKGRRGDASLRYDAKKGMGPGWVCVSETRGGR